MYSFYGGQKGQDFKITRIFANRSIELMRDLQARWHSPVNVGDYVFISYGDISQPDNYTYINESGETYDVQSSYSSNLSVDLEYCGRNYSNSIWQKIYVDENKKVSPTLPVFEEVNGITGDNNVFVFLNFEDSVESINAFDYEQLSAEEQAKYIHSIDPAYYIKGKDGEEIDSYGNVIDENGQIVKRRLLPGESLRQTSQIYTEENYGFGYRLIACVTGRTPRIEVESRVINIEDGNPYVSLDVTNIEKPKLTFYLQKAQKLNDRVSTLVTSPLENPDVDLITDGWVAMDGNGDDLEEATLSEPILQFELPRAIKYYSGYLFGKGSLSDYPYNISTIDSVPNSTSTFIVGQQDAWRFQAMSNVIFESTIAGYEDQDYSKIKVSNFRAKFKESIAQQDSLKGYYRNDNVSLYSYLVNDDYPYNENMIPWGQYGLDNKIHNSKEKIKNYFNEYENWELVEKTILRYFKIFNGNNNVTVSMPWGKYGCIKKEVFEQLLSKKEQYNYVKNYYDGLWTPGSIQNAVNQLTIITPIMDFRQTIIDIYNCEDEYYEFFENQGTYFRELLLQTHDYHYPHFCFVAEHAKAGDMYIHVPTGKLYQIDFTDSTSYPITERKIIVRYIGALTAPAPEVDYTLQSSFIKDSEGNWIENNPQIRDGILISGAEQQYKERYIFDIPKTPIWDVSYKEVNHKTDPKVVLERKNINENDPNSSDGKYNLAFELPRTPKHTWKHYVVNFQENPEVSVSEDRLDVNNEDDYIDIVTKIPRVPNFTIKEENVEVINYRNNPSVSIASIELGPEGSLSDNYEDYINLGFQLPREPLWETTLTKTINTTPPTIAKVEPEGKTNSNADNTIHLDFTLPRPIHIYTDNNLPTTGEITGFNDNGDGNPVTTINDSNDNLSEGDIYIHTACNKNNELGYDLSDDHRGYIYTYNGDGTWKRQGSILGPIGIPLPVNKIVLQAVYSGQEEGTYDIVKEDDKANTYTYWVNIKDTLTEEKLSNLISKITADWAVPELGQGPTVGKTYPKSYYGEMTQVLILTALSKTDDTTTSDTIENELQQEATYWAQWNNSQKKWYLTIMTSIGSWLNNDYIENDDITSKSVTYTAHYLNTILQWDTEKYY